MRGFFRMDYARAGGAGGTIVFTDGSVAGWDTGGCFFRGSYADDGMGIRGSLTMDFPNGGVSFKGAHISKGSKPFVVAFQIANSAKAEDMKLATETGDVTVKLTRVSAL